MKISEIINNTIIEGRKGKIPKRAEQAATGEHVWRDEGVDRVYNLNRVMMAAARADGRSKKGNNTPEESWVGKNNVARPYTEEEHNMMHQAFATIDSKHTHTIPDHRSLELDSTNKTSPVAKPKRNKYGV